MNNSASVYKQFVCATLIIWLLAVWGGLHGHFCFDGQEQAVSVHMDILSGHPDHVADQTKHEAPHIDADTSLPQWLQAKILLLDLTALITTLVFLLLMGVRSRAHHCTVLHRPLQRLHTLRPPLRAPPETSVC